MQERTEDNPKDQQAKPLLEGTVVHCGSDPISDAVDAAWIRINEIALKMSAEGHPAGEILKAIGFSIEQ